MRDLSTPEALWQAMVDLGLYSRCTGDDVAACREQFLDGAHEHGDDWLQWDDKRFEAEQQAELRDYKNYRSMQKFARFYREWLAK